MNKPQNWENTQVYGEFEPLAVGGHICKVMKVEEMQSRTGKDMLKIFLDIADGEQKGYYAEQYKNDNREEKKWGCIVYQLVEDKDGNTNKGLKTFISAVEKSNSNFKEKEIWNEKFATYFKDKLVGGVFGVDHYVNNNGELKQTVKLFNFRDVETIKKGVAIPAERYPNGYNKADTSEFNQNDFERVDISTDDLPF